MNPSSDEMPPHTKQQTTYFLTPDRWGTANKRRRKRKCFRLYLVHNYCAQQTIMRDEVEKKSWKYENPKNARLWHRRHLITSGRTTLIGLRWRCCAPRAWWRHTVLDDLHYRISVHFSIFFFIISFTQWIWIIELFCKTLVRSFGQFVDDAFVEWPENQQKCSDSTPYSL